MEYIFLILLFSSRKPLKFNNIRLLIINNKNAKTIFEYAKIGNSSYTTNNLPGNNIPKEKIKHQIIKNKLIVFNTNKLFLIFIKLPLFFDFIK